MLSSTFSKEQSNAVKGDLKSAAQPCIIGVLGTKGGIGASTLAINIAIKLAELNASGTTTLMDANLQQPDLSIMLARQSEYSLVDLLAKGGAIDRQVFEACCSEVPGSTLKIVSPPNDGKAGTKINLTDLVRCLSHIRTLSNRWIIDLPNNLDHHLVTMMDLCSLIVLVFEANLTSIAALKRWLDIFNELEYSLEKRIVVLNRSGAKFGHIEKQFSSSVDGKIIHRIPNNYEVSEGSCLDGEPIVIKFPKESYSKAVTKLASHIESVLRENLIVRPEGKSEDEVIIPSSLLSSVAGGT
jgi:pilus assembly protein CpaE